MFNKFYFPYVSWDGIESTVFVESVIIQNANPLADNVDDFFGYNEIEFYALDEIGETIEFCSREKSAIENIILEKV